MQLSNDILIAICEATDCIDTFARAQCAFRGARRDARFMGCRTAREVVAHPVYTAMDASARGRALAKFVKITHISNDDLAAAVEHPAVPAILALEWAISLRAVDLVAAVLDSAKWRKTRATNRFAPWFMSMFLSDAVRLGSHELVTLLIAHGAHVTADGYDAMRTAFELEHVHLYDILTARLLDLYR